MGEIKVNTTKGYAHVDFLLKPGHRKKLKI